MLNMKCHYTLTILDKYFDQFYWHSISKRVHVIAVWRIQEFMITIQYANEVLTHGLIERVLIGWKFGQFEILQDFTSWFQSCMQIWS